MVLKPHKAYVDVVLKQNTVYDTIHWTRLTIDNNWNRERSEEEEEEEKKKLYLIVKPKISAYFWQIFNEIWITCSYNTLGPNFAPNLKHI